VDDLVSVRGNILLVCFLLAAACALPDTDSSDDPDPTPEAVAADGWRACLTDDPCQGWAYCDERGATEEPSCAWQEDYSCHHWDFADGTSCFPTPSLGVGQCMKGRCE
jgi:hypothetical protein